MPATGERAPVHDRGKVLVQAMLMLAGGGLSCAAMRIRKRIEEPFGWITTIAGGRQLRYQGRDRNRAWFKITAAVYNLIRIVALDTQPA